MSADRACRASDSNVQRASYTVSLSASDTVLDRVAALRREGRRRRLLVQVPPFVTGVTIGALGAGLSLSSLTTRHSANNMALFGGVMCMHVGPWCAAIALRPQDKRVTRTFLTFASFLSGIGSVISAQRASDLLGSARVDRQRGVGEYLFFASFVTLCVSAAAAAFRWSYAVVADLWFAAPAHQTLLRLWHGAGVLDILATCAYATHAVVGLAFSSAATIQPEDAFVIVPLACSTLLLGVLSFWEPLRTRAQEALARIGEGVSAAAGIAELIGGLPPETVLDRARRSFRAVPIASLKREHLVRTAAQPEPERKLPPKGVERQARSTLASVMPPSRQPASPIREGAPGSPEAALVDDAAELFSVSVPAQLGSVDAFISHSWQDDADQKFAAIQRWRAQFVRLHNREPTVWFDGLCIDQRNVEAQLPSLPVYLAGCKSVLALQGRTYFERLWCAVELHIFHQMGGSLEQIVFVPLNDGGVDGGDPKRAAADAAAFDVRRSQASYADDQVRLLAVIEGSGEGIRAFNEWVRDTLLRAATHFSPPAGSPKRGYPRGMRDRDLRHPHQSKTRVQTGTRPPSWPV